MRVSCIKKKSSHTVPPYDTPIFTTSRKVLTGLGVLHLGGFGSNHATVLIQASHYANVCSENIRPKLQTMALLELCQRDSAKSAESTVKQHREVVLGTNIDELGWVKDITSLKNAVCNVATEGITAVKHADDFEETS